VNRPKKKGRKTKVPASDAALRSSRRRRRSQKKRIHSQPASIASNPRFGFRSTQRTTTTTLPRVGNARVAD